MDWKSRMDLLLQRASPDVRDVHALFAEFDRYNAQSRDDVACGERLEAMYKAVSQALNNKQQHMDAVLLWRFFIKGVQCVNMLQQNDARVKTYEVRRILMSDVWTCLGQASEQGIRRLGHTQRDFLECEGVGLLNLLQLPMKGLVSGSASNWMWQIFGYENSNMKVMQLALVVYACCHAVAEALHRHDLLFSWSYCMQVFRHVFDEPVPGTFIVVLRNLGGVLPLMRGRSTKDLEDMKNFIGAVSSAWSPPDLVWFAENLVDTTARDAFWASAWLCGSVQQSVRSSEISGSLMVLDCIRHAKLHSRVLMAIADSHLERSLCRLVSEVLVPRGWRVSDCEEVQDLMGQFLPIKSGTLI